MAESTKSPVLGSTADAEPYVPIAGMAVAAASMAAIFLLVLLVLAIDGVVRKKPPIVWELLLLPVVTMILCFAGRRIVRTSEGTRTGTAMGVDLITSAWWGALVTGLGYFAYLLAIDYSVGRDAEAESRRWVEYVIQDDAVHAFDRTLQPGSRIWPDEAKMKRLHRDSLLAFRQTDLIRLAARNKGLCQFAPGGLREWTYKPNGIECAYAGTVKCPEGSFPITVYLKAMETGAGSEGTTGRQWQVQFTPGGFIARERITLTAYGWAVTELEKRGRSVGRDFINTLNRAPGMQPYVFAGFAKPDADSAAWTLAGLSAPSRMSVIGGLGAGLSVWPDYRSALGGSFFRGPQDTELTPAQKEQFSAIWTTTGAVPAGTRLRMGFEMADLISFAEGAIEVRVPLELPLSNLNDTVARGMVVVACTDSGLIAELNQLRSSANADKAESDAPALFRTTPAQWRVLRLESDLVANSPKKQAPGGEGE